MSPCTSPNSAAMNSSTRTAFRLTAFRCFISLSFHQTARGTWDYERQSLHRSAGIHLSTLESNRSNASSHAMYRRNEHKPRDNNPQNKPVSPSKCGNRTWYLCVLG